MRRAIPSLLCALVVLALGASPARREPHDDPGRLLNLAQQHLARGEIDAAIDALDRSITGNPREGYAWSLLAEALIWGRALGPEVEASWEALAALDPGDGHAALRVVRAQMAAHRRDKFTAPDSDWVGEASARIEAVLSAAASKDVRHAALITQRDLLRQAGSPSEAAAAGQAAYALDPGPLQGRLSAMEASAAAHDAAGVEAACQGLIARDPWAVEACAMLWGFPEGEAARPRVLILVQALHPRALGDLVLANEVLKLYSRIKDQEAVSAWLAAVRAVDPTFVLADNPGWIRGTFLIAPSHARLYADTNRANAEADPLVRLQRLRGLEVADDDDHPLANRWRWRVVDAARATGDEATAEAFLRLIVTHDPADAGAWMRLAELVDDAEAIGALIQAQGAVLDGDWDPWALSGGSSFAQTMARRRQFVAELRRLRAIRLEASQGVEAAWPTALEAAWSSEHTNPEAWALVARLAEVGGRPRFAVEADVEHLSVLLDGDGEPTPELLPDALRRFAASRPELAQASSEQVWASLRAAAAARREARGPAFVPERELHPLVGELAPALDVQTLDGQPLSLDALAGRVVVIDFWASWCGPCKRAMPELQSAADRLGAAPVTFLLVSVDADQPSAEHAWREGGWTMTGAWHPDGEAAKSTWRVRGIPSTFILDADGVVRHHHQGFKAGAGAEIEHEILALLADRTAPVP